MTTPAPAESQPATYKHASIIAQDVRKLHPLLSLLEQQEKGGGGPIEIIQTLLETILTSQHQLHLSLEDLHHKLDAVTKRRPSSS